MCITTVGIFLLLITYRSKAKSLKLNQLQLPHLENDESGKK